ncbi:MAG TPA: hypothetical protein VJZ27_08120 [Aggregatilineales bacterium]|nr:hypothetical protein [Aggregatilineales bacterium]
MEVETAGNYNMAGFNDDIHTFLAITVRHDVWRRAGADWMEALVTRQIIDQAEAADMIHALACNLPDRTIDWMSNDTWNSYNI